MRDFAKHRLLKEMMETVRRHISVGDKEYVILVMDSSALKVFSSCCKLLDMYRAGVYHIERLEKKRKKYPSTNAVYLISPTQESVDLLIKDFVKPATEVVGGQMVVNDKRKG